MTHDDYEKVALVNERSNLDAVLYIEDGWKWIVMQTLAVKRFASIEGCPKIIEQFDGRSIRCHMHTLNACHNVHVLYLFDPLVVQGHTRSKQYRISIYRRWSMPEPISTVTFLVSHESLFPFILSTSCWNSIAGGIVYRSTFHNHLVNLCSMLFRPYAVHAGHQSA